MKVVSLCEGLDGELYRSKAECLIADAKHTFAEAVTQCSNPTIGFVVPDFLHMLEQDESLKQALAPMFAVKRKKADKKADVEPDVQADDSVPFEPPL